MTPIELAEKLKINIRLFYLLTNRVQEFYHTYKIPKKNGKFRTIEEPSPILKLVQKRILSEIIAELRPSTTATAFEIGSSIRENAGRHCGKAVILKLDLKDFFPSLKYPFLRNLFLEQGYPPNLAVMLTKLCSRLCKSRFFTKTRKKGRRVLAYTRPYLTKYW